MSLINFNYFRNAFANIVEEICEEEYEKMPAKVTKVKGDGYKVTTPSGVHAKGTTKAKATAQARLLNAVDHGWKPSKKRGK